jgi:hypothetical protein
VKYEFYEVNGRKCIRADLVFTYKGRDPIPPEPNCVDLYTWTCPWCDTTQEAGILYIVDRAPPKPHPHPTYDYCHYCLQEWRWRPDIDVWSAVFDPLSPKDIAKRQQDKKDHLQAVAEGREDEYVKEHPRWDS